MTDDDGELTAVVVRSVHAIDDFPEVVLWCHARIYVLTVRTVSSYVAISDLWLLGCIKRQV